MDKLKYIDHRYIFIPKLKNHKTGIRFPNSSNIAIVTTREKINLLKMKNGNKECWEEVKEEEEVNGDW